MKPDYKACLLILTGGGDTAVALVSEDAFAWINRDDTPGRKAGEYNWVDTAAPKSVSPDHRDGVCVTIGSYNNDRAIAAAFSNPTGEHGLPKTFGRVKEALAWTKRKNVEIVDEYHGCLY